MTKHQAAVEATRNLKRAIVAAGVIDKPGTMTDADIQRVAEAAGSVRSAVDAAGADLADIIVRAR
ncbi:hypothetical protein [Streptomyces sp. NPDC102264]|uniref:hypothetical protein n=1 Tax=Streptomyces sp. NPDC102264 TaxID=3366149 RepID=UPI0037F79478